MSSPVLLSCQSLTKSYSARPLFESITLGIAEGERAGLIGPNGAGKSTLLKIMAGQETPDAGTVSARRGLRVGYVAQEEEFGGNEDSATVGSVLRDALAGEPIDEAERAARIDALLAQMEFADPEQPVHSLSGGWRKRLSIAREIIRHPDLLLLDEPTNHLDLEGVLWLEDLLRAAPFAYVVVSHDRYLLENVARRIIDIDPAYADGYFSINGAYSDFLEKREAYLTAQARQEEALAVQVRREIAWLRRGAKARTTKAKGRIDAAGRMIDELSDLRQRNNPVAAVGVDFTASGRKTKELLVAKGLEKSLGGRTLFRNLDLMLSPGMKLGVVGTNGSGKTTLLRLLAGDLEPDRGEIKRAEGLRIVWFDQNREQLDRNATLRDALSPGSETVNYRGSVMHISAWAKRFRFRSEQLAGQVGFLSGGEQARVLIARLMLQPADILILDEPTNDLDIPTLEVLEERLSDFKGALVLVTHDRYLLDTTATHVLALEGDGKTPRFFADYAQWETVREEQKARATPSPTPRKPSAASPEPAAGLSRLSAAERRELRDMETTIEAAEEAVSALQAEMETPEVASDAARLQDCWNRLEEAKRRVAALYERWEELEARQNAGR